MDRDHLGEEWLRANDPDHVPSRDFDHKIRAIGLTAELEHAARKGGSLVEHGALPQARLCVRCHGPFQPYKSDHERCKPCGDLHRSERRRATQRELMRARRAVNATLEGYQRAA